MEYICRLLRSYPSFTEEFVWDRLAMIKGWAYVSWATENDAMNQFGGIRAISPTYLRQESEKLIAQAKEAWEKQ